MIKAVLLMVVLNMAAVAEGPALMPMPAKMTAGTGSLPIDPSFTIGSSGYSDARLTAAIERSASRISKQTGIPLLQPAPGAKKSAALVIECQQPGPAYPALGEDESYRLTVAATGARIKAKTVTGALRGLATFVQLVTQSSNGFQVGAVEIEDQPRFPWRGLMLDVSRHWMPVPVIERNLDALAAVKMNVFHWHLSDDQGFRVESQRFPKLQQLASDGHFYTQAEIRHMIDYARDRGIRVIPEFDIPGHSTALLTAYPELGSAPGPFSIERKFGIFEPTLDPTREQVYTFLDAFFGEMAGLFPDPYFHIGGDEVDPAEWKASASIQIFAATHKLEKPEDLQTYFNQRVQRLLTKHGKIMVGWDEVLHPGLAQNTVIQSWRGQQSLADAAKQGYRGVLSFGYYLDHLERASFHYGNDPLGGAAKDLDANRAAKILGGEACMWDEYASPETVDSRLWPRTAAIAERLWSPATVTDVDSMYARLDAVNRALDWTGVNHRSNYERVLGRMGPETPALRVLADAVEPMGLDGREKSREYTTLVPLNRMVDAARPESEAVRLLERAASLVTTNGVSEPEAAELRAALTAWSMNESALASLLRDDFLLQELTPVSQDLSAVGSIGLKALSYLESRQAAPQDWAADQIQRLDKMEKPQAELRLAATRPVRILVAAVARKAVASSSSH